MNKLEKIEYILASKIYEIGDFEDAIKIYCASELEFYCFNKKSLKEIFDRILNEVTDDFKICTEDSENQYEVCLNKARLSEIIKNTILVKNILLETKDVVLNPKPFTHLSGCSMQLNFSIYIGKTNIFQKRNQKLSNPLKSAIAGILNDIQESMIVFNPTDECYNRLQAYQEHGEIKNIHYPINISWGINNRTTAIRIPIDSQKNCFDLRIEHRVPSILSNPEKTFPLIIFSAINGIIENKQIHSQIYGNAHDVQYKLEPLIKTLNEAKLIQMKHQNKEFIDTIESILKEQ